MTALRARQAVPRGVVSAACCRRFNPSGRSGASHAPKPPPTVSSTAERPTTRSSTATSTAGQAPDRNGPYRGSLRRERYSACATERLSKTREHHKVGVKPDALNAAGPQRRQAVLVLQPP